MPGLNVPGGRLGALRSAGPVRQEQKTVSLHVARASSEGRCYKTAASKRSDHRRWRPNHSAINAKLFEVVSLVRTSEVGLISEITMSNLQNIFADGSAGRWRRAAFPAHSAAWLLSAAPSARSHRHGRKTSLPPRDPVLIAATRRKSAAVSAPVLSCCTAPTPAPGLPHS
jgi:hypothetical protein